MGRKRIRKCRICKKSPVWRGGDVKNPGPYCKRCYHKHVWSGGSGSRRRPTSDRIPDTTDTPPLAASYDWPAMEMVYGESGVHEPIDDDSESIGDDEQIPF
jgi:hypothetical protein